MILKKPYAFLIKHFRLIHIILLVLNIYITYKLSAIATFFRSYVLNDYSAIITTNFTSNFINFTLILSLILSIIITIFIIFLFKTKQKPRKYYIFSLIHYILTIIFIIIIYGILTTLETSTLAQDISRIYRDLSILVFIPYFAFIVIDIVRALGFNIKQFNFDKDIKDLTISEKDSEEVEVNLGFDTYKQKRTLRRFLREFNYYVKENKFIVLCIIVISVGVVIYLLSSGASSYITKRGTNDTFNYKGLTMSIDDSIITNLDAGGHVIKDDTYFILLKVTIKNNTSSKIKFDYDNLKIYYGQNHINPELDTAYHFVDYAIPYQDKDFNPKDGSTYVFAYPIKKNLINQKFVVEMHTGVIQKNNNYFAETTQISINPVEISEISEVGTYPLNQEINLNNTYLKGSTINLTKYEITNKVLYNYQSCFNSNCNTYQDLITNNNSTQTYINLIGKIKIDENSVFAKTSKLTDTFINTFFSVEGIKNGVKSTYSVKNVTPGNYTDGYIISSSSNLSDADKINLIVTIRNKKFIINLKS